MAIINLGYFPNKFATDGLLYRTDQQKLYVNAGTFDSPVYNVIVQLNLNPLFGDGEDGDLIVSGTTTLTQTKYFNNVTVQTGATLTANEPLFMFVKGTLSIEGTGIVNMDAKGGAGGAAGNSQEGIGNPGAGTPAPLGTGGAGSASTVKSNPAASGGASGGGVGGDGGGGFPGGPGGTGGPGPGPGGSTPGGTILDRKFHSVFQLLAEDPILQGSGAGGAGGGGAASGGSGGGVGAPCNISGGSGGQGADGGAAGAGGGTIIIFAKNIVIAASARISSDGTDGLAGIAGGTAPVVDGKNGSTSGPPLGRTSGGGGGASASGGSGGGGGSGGLILLIFVSLDEIGSIQVAAGNGGSAGAAGPAHGLAGAGPNPGGSTAATGPLEAGNAGSNGIVGKIIRSQV